MMSEALLKPGSRVTRKRSAKLEAILDEGARLINKNGAGSVRLGEIAETLGLSRNALYYYVKDRSELVRQCYVRACDTIEENLEFVATSQGTPADKVADFIHRTLLPDHPHRAALADIDVLHEADRKRVKHRRESHARALADILRDGQQSRELRSFNPDIAAYAIMGMLDWVLLWVHWVSKGKQCNPEKLEDYADALIDCLMNGFVHSGEYTFQCPIDYESITRQQYNVFDRSDANRLRRHQLIEAASAIFNKTGLDGTSVDAIANEVGASKGAIYHHFEDKTELIEACYEHAFHIYELIAERSHTEELGDDEKLLADFHLNCQAQASRTPPLILQPGVMRLPDRYLRRSKTLAGLMLSTLEAGRRKRKIRRTSPLVVEVTPGAFFWIARWRDAQFSDVSSIELADELTSIVGAGIIRRAGSN